MKKIANCYFAVLFLLLLLPEFVLAQDWELIWSDEFETDTLDQDNWSYQYGTAASEGLTGWGNNELQYYTDREENIFIEDDKLHIVAKPEIYGGMDFTSARIRSKNKADFRYGRFEARAKLPKGQGLWPAIWMMPTDDVYGGWPKSGEIDIMELVGHEPDVVHGTVHYGPDWPDNRHTGGRYELDEGTFNDGFHTFAIEWIPERIRWFVDDQFFFQVTPDNLSPHRWPFDQYFHFIMNVAVGGDWPGRPDGTTEFPQEMVIDYVRVYKQADATSAEEHDELPDRTRLNQNYPNPFNPATRISFELEQDQQVQLEVFDMLGRPVATLANGQFSAGLHTVTMNAGELTSGKYIYRLQTENRTLSRSMMLVK